MTVGKMYVMLLLRALFIDAGTWVGGEQPLHEEEVVITRMMIEVINPLSRGFILTRAISFKTLNL